MLGGGCPVNWWFRSSHSPSPRGKRQSLLTCDLAGSCAKTDDAERFVQDQVFHRALCTNPATSFLTDKGAVPGGCHGEDVCSFPGAPMSPCLPAAASGGHGVEGPCLPVTRLPALVRLLWFPQSLPLLPAHRAAPPAAYPGTTLVQAADSLEFRGMPYTTILAAQTPRAPVAIQSRTCVLFHLLDPSIPARAGKVIKTL